MRILCVGISHKTADIALREKLAFDVAGRAEALATLPQRWSDAEFAILSTCNRVEIYTARPVHGHPREQELVEFLGQFHDVPSEQLAGAMYTLSDGEAARHLFSVAAGLDSLVPGEAQITAQVKDAYSAALEAGTARAVLNELFKQALHAAKHVRTETCVAEGKASVASVAVDCIKNQLDSLTGRCVLSIGAGKMNQLMLKYLKKLGAERILVANRSPDRARKLAEQCGGLAVGFDDLGVHLRQADIVLTSTGSDSPIITSQMLASAQGQRDGRPMLIVDLAVPRDVEPAAGELEGVSLYNIDEMDEVVRQTIKSRRSDVAAAERIIDLHTAELMERINIRQVAPTIDELYRKMERICDEELAAAGKKLTGHDDADADMAILTQAMRRTIRRIMHPCVQNLRGSAGSDAARAHIAALRKLFGLDQQQKP